MTKILFICGKNRRRSPSAEEIFSGMDGIEVSSAGTSTEAECPVSADLLDWADRIFVMERSQQRYLRARFAPIVKNKKIVCLNIPDVYTYMQPELVVALRTKVLPLLRSKGFRFEINLRIEPHDDSQLLQGNSFRLLSGLDGWAEGSGGSAEG